MTYRPSRSLEVAALSSVPTCTTTVAPGNGSLPLVTRPSTRHRGAPCAAGAGVDCGDRAPAATPAATLTTNPRPSRAKPECRLSDDTPSTTTSSSDCCKGLTLTLRLGFGRSRRVEFERHAIHAVAQPRGLGAVGKH